MIFFLLGFVFGVAVAGLIINHRFTIVRFWHEEVYFLAIASWAKLFHRADYEEAERLRQSQSQRKDVGL